MTTSFRIVTCADANFFHFLPALERNIHQKTGQYPIIYDLGLTAAQRGRLRSEVIAIKPPEGYHENIPQGAIRASHKPNCLLDALKRFEMDLLYVDADVLIIDAPHPTEFAECDVAVTPRHPNEMRVSQPFKNGRINSGVIYFANNERCGALLSDWHALCAKGAHTDQMALSDLLEAADLSVGLGLVAVDGLRVLKLDARVYNDVGSTTGKLWHFKNAGRRFHKKRRWWYTTMLLRFAPGWLSARTAKARDAALSQSD